MLLAFLLKRLGGFWRVREKAKNGAFSIFYKAVYAIFVNHENSYIPLSTKFESSPHFPHGISGIFISSDSVIGKDCIIFHQVTIGSNNLPDSKGLGAPHIGDNCYISAGAKIVGNVKIGDNVRIGANCVVFKDVPSNSIVVGGNPRVIQKERINNKFYTRKNNIWGYYYNGEWVKENNEDTLQNLNKRR